MRMWTIGVLLQSSTTTYVLALVLVKYSLLQDTENPNQSNQNNISKGDIQWKYSEVAHIIQKKAVRIRVVTITLGT